MLIPVREELDQLEPEEGNATLHPHTCQRVPLVAMPKRRPL